jgi:hypothetical protein
VDAPAITEIHKWLGITLEGWLTIAAVVIGPILALGAQRVLDNLRERHERQVRLFRELMVTRSSRLSARHVEALNGVPLEFEDSGKEMRVITAWKTYLDHLGTDATKDGATWNRVGGELLVELLYEISRRVGYTFEKPRIIGEVYLPQLFNTLEVEQTALRQRLLELTDGKGTRKLPVAIFETRFPDLVDESKPPEK